MNILKTKNPGFKKELLSILGKRSRREWEDARTAVRKILKDVREKGDEALIFFTKKLDHCEIDMDEITVDQEEIEEAYKTVGKDFIDALKRAYRNIWEFHEKQKENSWFYFKEGSLLGQIVRPIESVGIYVPGGKAAYPSTVLMNAIPARVAGVDKIYMATPPRKDKRINPYILAAAKMCGVDKVFRVGGAQAIAALAYGTETVPKVDKIVGPGNIYVTLAKKELFGEVDIDMIAGPSEIAVIADETADPEFVACDLLSQAEHDERAMVVLITDSEDFAFMVFKYIEYFINESKNGKFKENIKVAKKSVENYGIIIITQNLEEAVEIVNVIAPEHLEIMAKDSWEILKGIKNAGTVFLGKYSAEPIGDYVAGTNHVLPTNGTARFFSPLGVYDFVKRINVVEYSKESFGLYAKDAVKIAECEGLLLHANSLKVRMKDVQGEVENL